MWPFKENRKMEVYSYNYFVYFEEGDENFDLKRIEDGSRLLCKSLNLKVLDFVYYGFDAPWESDYEISSSGVFLLSTSHLAWHSYPEDGRVHFSLSTCGPKIEVSDLNKQIELSYSKVTGIEHYTCVIKS